MPLTPPDPPLADDAITLEPLAQRHVPVFQTLVLEDDIRRFTMVPTRPDRHFAANWVARYERGWAEGSRAGFAILGGDGAIVGFAGIFGLDDPGAEGEIGYLVAAEARGQGIAGRSVALLTRWGFDELGLERIELRIDTRQRRLGPGGGAGGLPPRRGPALEALQGRPPDRPRDLVQAALRRANAVDG